MDFIEQIYKKPISSYKGVVFVDRDGTVIKRHNYLRSIEQVEILPGVVEGLKLLKKAGYIFIVITNQPVIARGYIRIPELKKINDYVVSLFNKEGIEFNAVYSCPHHPDADLKKYRTKCLCRKPESAMFERAIKKLDLNTKNAFMVGDFVTDVTAGKRMGMRSFHITDTNNFLRIAKKILSTKL